MDKPATAEVAKRREVYVYSELWHASSCVLDAGINEPRGCSWQFLSSAILTAFAFEAYLNHIGSLLFHSWSGLDRLSPGAKFELLCEGLKVAFPQGAGARPLQTVNELFQFRNTMAHGRSETVELVSAKRDINDTLDRYLGEKPIAHWERLIQTADFAKRVREDVQQVLEGLHKARPEPKEALFTFGMGTHNATLATEP